MEIAIAIGLGAWFVLAGVCSYLAVDKSYRKIEKSKKERAAK